MSESHGPMWRRYLRFWGSDPGADIDEEIAFHLALRRQQLEREGLDSQTAALRARARFGDVRRIRKECMAIDRSENRAARRAEWLDGIRQDVRLAVRSLLRNPIATGATLLVLALGVGAGAAVYALADAILLRPLPGVVESGQVFEVTEYSFSYSAFSDLRRESTGVADLAVFSARNVALEAGDRVELSDAVVVSGNYFTLLGVRPAAGRLLQEVDEAPGAAPAVVLSFPLWRTRFGGDSAVLGSQVRINGRPATIVGVSEAGFGGTRLTRRADLWMTPAAWLAAAGRRYEGLGLDGRGWTWLTGLARPRPGVSREQAEAALTRSASALAEQFPNFSDANPTVALEPVANTTTGPEGHGLVVGFVTLLAVTVGLVLLLTAANVASLLLARAADRGRELATRVALGATRRRLARQLLTESVVLSLAGAAAAIGVIVLVLGALARWTFPGGVSIADLDLRLDWSVLAVALVLAGATGLLFGIAPALRAGAGSVVPTLRDGRATGGLGRQRLRRVLLTAQVAIGLLLLIGAGLFTRSLQRAFATDVGFRTDRIAGTTVLLGLAGYTTERAGPYYDGALRRVRALPGVRSATWAMAPPLDAGAYEESFDVVGDPPPEGRPPATELNVVSEDYFETLGIPIVRGRGFTTADGPGAEHVAVVNETFARTHLGGDPLGRRVVIMGDTLRVIGVASDVIYHELDEAPVPYLYGALGQQVAASGLSPFTLLAHTEGPPEELLRPLRDAVSSQDPLVPVLQPSTLEAQLGEVLLPERLGLLIVGGFGVLATVVAAFGIGGAAAYTVSRRRQEIAVRLALGASPAAAVSGVLRSTTFAVLLGLGIGLTGGVVVSRFLARLLYGLGALEPVTLLLTVLLLALLSLLAAALPARAALRLEPMDVLRTE